jgi:hypothetical protein
MALLRIRPSRADIEIAEQISDRTSPEVERIAEALTWGADEHVMCALAAGWWFYCRRRSPRHRADSNHILLTTVAVTLLPHFLKSIFDQERPDRLMVRGHLHGVPFSGKPLDAFPSGHAIHVGALSGLVDRRGPGPDADRSAGALDQRCDRGPRNRSRGRAAAQALDGFRIAPPGIVGPRGILASKSGGACLKTSAPPAATWR